MLDSNDYRDQISSSSEEENENGDLLLLRHEDVEERFRDYKYYSKETKEREEKHKLKEDKLKEEKIRKQSTNAATTTNTHYSIMDEKDSCRSKPKVNNFLK